MSLKCYKYRLPFKQPLKTTRGSFEERNGLILEFSFDGQSFYGDVAPLPGFSQESFEEVKALITRHQEQVDDLLNLTDPTESLGKLFHDENLPPSLQFGLDTVALQAIAHRKGSTLQHELFSEPVKAVPVNALGNLLSDQFLQQIEQLVTEGYKTVKFKVGLEFDQEYNQLQKVRSQYPSLKFRLDANQKWPLEEAIVNCNRLEEIGIEYCEEPLADPSPENFEILAKKTGLPLALDESISRVSYWPNLLPYTSHAVVKPMVIGSFSKNLETKALINTHNNKVVYTTSLESSVGRQATAILASGSGNTTTAHGLTTGSLLTKDVHADNCYISDGKYNIAPIRHRLQINTSKLHHVSSRLF